MTKRDEIITDLYKSEKLNKAIVNITKNDPLKEDLKSELFYILCSMPYEKLLAAKEEGYLLFLCINILKKQYNSSTSPFHKTYRAKSNYSSIEDDMIEDNGLEDDLYLEDLVLKEVNKVLDELSYTDRELFKIYFKQGEYDRWTGIKRDTECTKSISSSRKIEKKLAIQSIKGQSRLTIDHSTIAKSVKKTLEKIREHFDKINMEL